MLARGKCNLFVTCDMLLVFQQIRWQSITVRPFRWSMLLNKVIFYYKVSKSANTSIFIVCLSTSCHQMRPLFLSVHVKSRWLSFYFGILIHSSFFLTDKKSLFYFHQKEISFSSLHMFLHQSSISHHRSTHLHTANVNGSLRKINDFSTHHLKFSFI